MATLKTRISLRYDLYNRWMEVDPVLLSGEMAIATAVAESNTGMTEPAVLIKVGDGTSKYSELDFITAKAGDVLQACKTTEGLTAFINKVLVDAGVITDGETGEGASLSERVTEAEKDIDALQKADEEIRAEIAAKIASVYRASGSVASADALPAADATTLGNVYNVTADFQTTDKFIEGAGKTVPAGSNVVIVETKAATGNGFDGTTASVYNFADKTGSYSPYVNGKKLGGVSLDVSILKNDAVERTVERLNDTSNNETATYQPYTYNATTGKIFDKDGNFVTFVNSTNLSDVITFKEGTPAEYGYDVVGSFINMTDYLNKADTEKLVSDTKEEIIAMIPEEVNKALTPQEVPVDPEDPSQGTTTEKSPLLEKVETIITEKVDSLDYADDGQPGFVTKVTQTDGLIAVVKKALETGDISNFESEVQTVIKESLTKPEPADPDNPTEEETAAKELYDQIMSEVTKLINEALAGKDGEDGSDGANGLTETIEKIVQEAIKNAGKPADPEAGTPEVPASGLNTAVKEVVTGELDKLDYVDDGTTGVVTKVEQTDGLIAVTKTALKDVEGFTDAIGEGVSDALQPPAEGETNPIYEKLVESITNTVTKEIEKIPADGETNDLTEAIKKAVDEALKDAGTPGDTETGTPAVPGSVLNTTVNNMIDSKIDELDVTDAEEENKVVVAVAQTNGLVEVTKKELAPVAFSGKIEDLNQDEDLIIDCGNSGAGA